MTTIGNVQPLASLGLRADRRFTGSSEPEGRPGTRPLALRTLHPAPAREIPAYVYDPELQIATDPDGEPLEPNMAKQWTTDGTHTDGDGGDNEGWSWEESSS